MVRETEKEDADRRREAAIASAAASLSPNFNPKSKALTQARLSKFQELHKRRLQIKAKSKVNKRGKGGLGDAKGKTHNTALQAHDQKPNKPVVDSTTPIPENGVGLISSTDEDNVAAKTRQKLHWGLDAKERWERKSNM